MGKNCIVPSSSTERLEKLYGKDGFSLIAEWGTAGINFDVFDKKKENLIKSSLFPDLLNHKEFSKLNKEEQIIQAFNKYLEIYSDEFIQKYGDWINNPSSFTGYKYPNTGEPDVKNLFKENKSESKTDIELEKAVAFLKGTVRDLEEKVTVLERKYNSQEERGDLRAVIESLKRSLNKEQIKLGIKTYLMYLKTNRLNTLVAQVESAKNNPEETNSKFINDLHDFVKNHRVNLDRLTFATQSTPELRKYYKEELESIVIEIKSDFNIIDEYANAAHKNLVINLIVDEYRGKKYKGQEITEEIAEGWITDTIKDSWGITPWFGVPSDSTDPIIRMVVHIIAKMQDKIRKTVNPEIENLLSVQEKLKQSGITDMSIFQEKVNGKKTGFILTEALWGKYHDAQNDVMQKLITAFGVEEYGDVVNHIDDLRKKDPSTYKKSDDYKLYSSSWGLFFEKFCKQDENGRYIPDTSKFLNPDFNKIVSNDIVKEYYKMLLGFHMRMKERQPTRFRTGIYKYLLPQIQLDTKEGFAKKGFKKGLKNMNRELSEAFITTQEDIDSGDIHKDKNGNILKLIPLHYNSRLENPDNISDDTTGIYKMYGIMAENFRQVSEVKDDIELIKKAMGERTLKTEHSVAMIENLIETQLYGKKVNEIVANIGGKNIRMDKIIRILIKKYPSVVNMFMNIPVAITSVVKASIDSRVENFVGKHTTNESSLEADIELATNIPRVIAEIGNRKKTNPIDLMLRYNQLEDITNKAYRDLNIETKAGRFLSPDAFYTSFMPGSFYTLSKLGISLYKNYRLIDNKFITNYDLKQYYKQKSGKIAESEFKKTPEYETYKKKWKESKGKSLFEAYEEKNGQWVIRENYKKYISTDFETQISLKLQKLNSRIEGTLGNLDRGGIYNTVWGDAVMLHRQWIPQLVSNRFKNRGWEFALEEEGEGFYRTAARVFRNMIYEEGKFRLKAMKWDELEAFEKRNMKRITMDMAFLVTAKIVALALNSIAEDDDDDVWFIEYMAYQANRILLEQGAFYRPTGIFDLIKSPMAGINQMEKWGNILQMLGSGSDIIESGAYKGMSKFERFLIQQSLLKNLYEIQYPKVKNTWLKTQQLPKNSMLESLFTGG